MSVPPESEYPCLLMETAKIFANQCSAHVQIQSKARALHICLQAPQIMQQFVGHVDIGKDPAGLLFYNNAQLDFSIPDQEFRYTTHGTGRWITVQIDFYLTDDGASDYLASRFLARVDSHNHTTVLEGDQPSGRGNWSRFPVGTAQGVCLRAEGRTRFYLQLPAVKKYVFFETEHSSPIEEKGGIFIFKDDGNLQDMVDDRAVFATWTADRIVFYLEGHPENIVGQFLSHAATGIGNMKQPSKTSWKSMDDDD